MGAWSWFLNQRDPIAARLVTDAGGIVNLADYLDFDQMFDSRYQTVKNGAALLSRTCDVGVEDYHYGLRVPAGREFVLFARVLTVGEGAYEIDAATSEGGFTGGTAAYKTTLKAGGEQSVTTDLLCGCTPVSTLTIRDQDYIDNGLNRGSARASAGSRADGLLRIFGPGETGILRVKRLQSVNYKANIRMVCWERAL